MGEITRKKKNYVKSSAKLRIFDDGGELINIDLNYEDLGRLPRNERGWVKIVASRNKQPDSFGNDYSIYENEWKPDLNKKRTGEISAPVTSKGKSDIDNLPF